MAVLYVFFPDAVTTYYDEFFLAWLALELPHVGLAGDHLLIVWKLRVLFVLEVPERTSQIESAIDSAHVNHTSRVANALNLPLILWFVID